MDDRYKSDIAVDEVQSLSEVGYHPAILPNGNCASVDSPGTSFDGVNDERVGVFDYITSSSSKKTSNGPFETDVAALRVTSASHTESKSPQHWANGTDTFRSATAVSNNATELTTFRCIEIEHRSSDAAKMPLSNGGTGAPNRYISDTPDGAEVVTEDLQEVIVESEIKPQRVSYQRFNPSVHSAARSEPSSADEANCDNKTVPVYSSSVNRTQGPRGSIGLTDESFAAAGSQNSLELGCSQATSRYEASSRDSAELGSLQPRSMPDREYDPSITQPNIVYLDNFLRAGSFLPEGFDERFGMPTPHSEAGRRILRKRQRREQRRAEESAVRRSEDVKEYKGTLALDELLAFINNGKFEKAADAASSAPGVYSKDHSIRRKKKPDAQAAAEMSDTASSVAEDLSSCSGSEGPRAATSDRPTLVDVSFASSNRPIVSVIPRADSSSPPSDLSSPTDNVSSPTEPEQFTVVKTKRKKSKPNVQSIQKHSFHDDLWRKPYSFTPKVPATNRPRPIPGAAYSVGNDGRHDDLNSLASDTQSETSSIVREHVNEASIRSYSPDFPDLLADGDVQQIRRNSTGNVCDIVTVSAKTSLPTTQSFSASYAVVAKSGLVATGTKTSADRRPSADGSTAAAADVTVTINISMHDKAASVSDSLTSTSRSSVTATVAATRPNKSPINALSDFSVSPHIPENKNILTISHLPASSITESTVDVIKSGSDAKDFRDQFPVPIKPDKQPPGVAASVSSVEHKASAQLSHNAQPEIPVVTGVTPIPFTDTKTSVVQTTLQITSTFPKVLSTSEMKTKKPVVFLDVSNAANHRRSNACSSIGISFGFDDTENIPSASSTVERRTNSSGIDCSSGCARCATSDHAVTASVSSIDSATSPIDPLDFDPTPSEKAPTVVATCHGRPIVPLSATSHQVPINTPVGIVPPIPHVERLVEASPPASVADDCDDKIAATPDIIIPLDEISENTANELRSDANAATNKSSTSAVVDKTSSGSDPQEMKAGHSGSTDAGGSVISRNGLFHLLGCQIFLYKGFEDALLEKNQCPGKVLQYCEDL